MSDTADNADRIEREIREMLRSQYFAVLSTRGETHPYGTLVGFAATADLRHLLFATMRHTRKHRNIDADNRVSLLVDTRTNRAEDLREAQALTALGEAREARGTKRGRYESLYLERHPHLAGFLADPQTALFAVRISRYILVSRFQEVFELDMR